MKRCFFTLILYFSGVVCFAQSTELGGIRAYVLRPTDSLKYVDALNRLATLLYEKNIDSTFYYTLRAREMANRLNYSKGKADALNNLGIIYDIKGNLQLALRYYNEANVKYNQLHDTANYVQTIMNIAMVYKEIGKDDRAVQRFNTALSIGKKLSRDSIMSLVIYNFILQYPEKFKSDSLSYYINKAKNTALKYNDNRAIIAIKQLVADNLITNGKTQQGMAILDETLKEAIQKKLYYVSMDIMIDLGDQRSKTDSAKAANYYLEGLDIAGKNHYLIYSQVMARKLFELYTNWHNDRKATTFSKLLVKLHDEQEKLDNSSGVDYLDYAIKDEEVKSLEVQSSYQRALLILAIVICLLAVVVIIVIRRNLKSTRQLNLQIINQNTQMKKALSDLEQSQADNTRMLKIVAHDLRNPIGGMYSIASMMLDEPNRSENDRMMLDMIKISGKNSLELVSHLLQVQFKAEELKKEPVDISEMLHYCVSLLANKAEAKAQRINLQSEPFILPASREKLWRVISNLIANAIKFSPSGAVVDIKMEHSPQQVLISVQDHGIGIPPEMQHKIFDMFTEAKRPGTAGEQPFGLGLAISKQIVEAHGGKIWFESDPEGGTTFFVALPTAA